MGTICTDARCTRPETGDAGATRDGSLADAALAPDGGLIPAGECTVSPSPEPFASPALELHWRGTGLPFPEMEQVIVSPIVIDLVEDGPDDLIPELVFVSYETFDRAGVLRVVSGRAPHETLLTLAGDGTGPVLDDTLATPSIRFDAHPAAGDIDADGDIEIVAVRQGGGAVAIQHDGAELWRVSALDLPASESTPNASVALADLDQDGAPEVIIGRVVIDGSTGMLRWTGSGGRGMNGQGPLSCVADVAPTPGMELIAGNTVYDASGGVVWSASGSGDGFCAVADLFDASGALGRDGSPEVGSSRVDLQACKLEYSIVSPK